MKRFALITIFFLLHGAAAAIAETNTRSGALNDYLELSVVTDARISPTGMHAAWKVFHNEFDDDRQDTQLWIAGIADGRTWQLTRGDESVGDYAWTPDGEWIAFTRGDGTYLIRSAGGEAIKLEIDGIKNVGSLRFAPDGSSLYVLGVAEPDLWAKAREEEYGDYTVFREEGDYTHIWRQGLTKSMALDDDPEPLTEGEDFSVTEFTLSPDGTQIAFAAQPTPQLADLLNGKVYRLPASGGEPEILMDAPGRKSRLVWRQDGARLAFAATAGFPDYADIVSVAADGTDLQIHEMPEYDARLVRYDGSALLFEAGVRTHYGRYQLDLKSGEVSSLDGPGHYASTSVSKAGAVSAFIGAASGGLAEVYVEDAKGRRIITSYNDQLEDIWQPQQTIVQWKSFDGLEIEGVLTWPRDYVKGQTYPLFVRTHGGPTATDKPGLLDASRRIYPPAVLAARGDGAFVLQSNYRGSAGYGAAFQKTNLRQLGIGPARDIIAGVERLVSDGLVDPARVGCLGWSQGGHISAMLATYSDVCAAAIMGAGISDWRTYYYNTDITQFTTEYLAATPLDDDGVYALTSPVTYIEKARTPTLIQHGEKDARVPIANGYQLRQLLIDRGIRSRMIVYNDMGHGPRTPRHLRAITEHALDWFDEFLFDEDSADFVRPVEPEEDRDGAAVTDHDHDAYKNVPHRGTAKKRPL
ncbi:MAG: prolyl oligopeptidase family serine peptidase [Chromatocurvus sp.]